MQIQQLENLLGKLPGAVLIVDRWKKIVICNDRARAVFGADLPGHHLLAAIRQPEVLAAVSDVLASRETRIVRYETRRPTETVFSIQVGFLDEEEDGIGGALLHFTDVTTVERAERLRSDFVANVSHELRSPLTALTGFIETLQGPAAEDAQARQSFLEIMQGEAGRMKGLIDDLLSLSRVEAMERVVPRGEVDLGELLRAVCKAQQPRADKAGVEIEFSQPLEAIHIQGDRDQLFQVFQNLIENAIKYGGGKNVRIAISTMDKAVGIDGPAVQIDVIDHGPGIAPVHIPRLTERFYRVDSHRARDVGGTGLGLAIVKHITMRHRGRLKIQSTEGEGSVFSVILPTGNQP
ncbi:MAG: ATP-binding protein [Paracoccaceae bacterium]|nr:ATP-binding protein [Paracoccaceae bacterium]